MLRVSRRLLAGCTVALAGLQAAAVFLAAPAGADTVRDTEAWVLDAVNVQPAWSITQGQGSVVAVIDSGVNPDVSDLKGSVITGTDFSGVSTPSTDRYWGVHGTWMASLIAGHGHGDASGIIGMAPAARVLSIRVITDQFDPNYRTYEHEPASQGQSELAAAITYAVRRGADVISMSLGYSEQSRVVRDALQYAYNHDVLVVASAGNSGQQSGTSQTGQAPYSFPADYPGVLAVGAVNRAGSPASFSSDNLSVQVVAPGVRVPAQGRDGQYWIVSGTSPACALTAGVAALIKAKYPHLTDTQVISAITGSTTSRPPHGYNTEVGFGEVDAAAALQAAGRLDRTVAATAGVSQAHHFGGGDAANPPPPVSPRGDSALILYCLLGVCCLTLIGVAISRIFALRDQRTSDPAVTMPEPAPHPSAPRIGLVQPGRHAAPRSRMESGRSDE
jgi:type VII secretion-associated serine protease mycosin